MKAPSRLVLLHGFTQRGVMWQPVLDVILERQREFLTWEFVTPDMPGHGNVPVPPDDTIEAAADRIADECGPGHYVGYSLGGRVLLQLALRRRDVLHSLTVIGARPGYEDPSEAKSRRESDELLADRLEKMDQRSFRTWLEDEWLAADMFSGLDSFSRELEARLTNRPAQLAESLRRYGSGTMAWLVPELHRIDAPCLVLCGSRDAAPIRAACSSVSGAIPKATLQEISGVGHAVPWEAPERFADLLGAHLGATAGGRRSDP